LLIYIIKQIKSLKPESPLLTEKNAANPFDLDYSKHSASCWNSEYRDNYNSLFLNNIVNDMEDTEAPKRTVLKEGSENELLNDNVSLLNAENVIAGVPSDMKFTSTKPLYFAWQGAGKYRSTIYSLVLFLFIII
jgi:hypothetical protein